MFLWEMSTNVAEAIPYNDFWDRIRKVNEELSKGRHVEIVDELNIIYSAKKWGDDNRG